VERIRLPTPETLLVAFAAAVFVFHHLPVLAGDWVDLVTPLAVVGTAVLVLAELDPPPAVFAVALVAAAAYVDGHGIHLAANSVDNLHPTGAVGHKAHFWDERFGHFEWHAGWFALLGAICLAERSRSRPAAIPRGETIAVVVLLGFSLFTNTVEGGTWPLELAATAVFVAWALSERRRPLLRVVATSFAIGAALIGVWAVWHGGVPQFSQLGWL
jgi:hypothetical protein